MKKQTLNEQAETIRANIWADAVVRAVRWIAWAAILAGLVLPLAYDAWRASGPLVGLVVLALCMALCWNVKPSGSSYGARVREIEREHWPKE